MCVAIPLAWVQRRTWLRFPADFRLADVRLDDSGDQAGPTGQPLFGIREPYGVESTVGEQPAQWLRLPITRTVAHPRQPGEFGVFAQDQIAQGATGQAVVVTPSPNVASSPADPGLLIEPDGSPNRGRCRAGRPMRGSPV